MSKCMAEIKYGPYAAFSFIVFNNCRLNLTGATNGMPQYRFVPPVNETGVFLQVGKKSRSAIIPYLIVSARPDR